MTRILAPAAAVAAVLALATGTAVALPGDIERVSVTNAGADPDDGSFEPALSANGAIVAFESEASNLLGPGLDTAGDLDVFHRNRISGTTTRDSVLDGSGEEAGTSVPGEAPAVIDKGVLVYFDSAAQLEAGDTDSNLDVYFHDPLGGDTARESVAVGGGNSDGNNVNVAVNSNASRLVWQSTASKLVASDLNGATADVFERFGGGNTLVSVSTDPDGANGASGNPVIADGGADIVAWDSTASDLISLDTNAKSDVFVRAGGTTTRVSVTGSGAESSGSSVLPAISANGNVVAFASNGDLAPGGIPGSSGIFARDRFRGSTERIDMTYDGSASEGTQLPGTTLGSTDPPSISDDGRYVAFSSDEDSLVRGDTNGNQDVFVRDRTLDRTIRVDVPEAGGQTLLRSAAPVISDDGKVVAFASQDKGLVPNDATPVTSDFWEIFAVEIDWTPPDSSFRSAPPAVTTARQVGVSFGSSEPASSFECRLDDRPFAPCPAGYLTPVLGVGRHTVAVRAVDRFGNVDGSPASASFTVQDAADAPPQPDYRDTVVAEPTSGTVLVKLPGSDEYVPLASVAALPVGTLVDARRGRVRITVERGEGGPIDSAVFWAGIFQIRQYATSSARRRRKRPVTELRLRGKIGPCPKPRRRARSSDARDAYDARRRRRKRRRLWGRGRGRFRSRGRRSAAAVRGTTWLVEDRCDGTLTVVRAGKVAVRDFVRKKDIRLKKGQRYLARNKRKRRRRR